MPTALPRSVRAKLGDEAADDFTRWLDRAVRERAVPRDEYREVLSRLEVLEQRMDGVENELAQQRREMSERFAQIDERFDQMQAQFGGRFDRIHEAMRVQTRWTVGTIALFGTIVTVLLAIAEFGA